MAELSAVVVRRAYKCGYPSGCKYEFINGKLRTERLNASYFRTLWEAKVLIEMWRKEYNTFRPHRALKLRTPAEFAKIWNA